MTIKMNFVRKYNLIESDNLISSEFASFAKFGIVLFNIDHYRLFNIDKFFF